MSPIPPNREMEEKKESMSNENLNRDDETNEIYNEAYEANGEYVPLSQDVNYTYRSVQNANQTSDTTSGSSSEDDEIEEKYVEIDPDTEFDLIASSRADPSFRIAKENDARFEKNTHLTEIDVFQRKNQLEPEDILIDENTSKKITGIMSNFKLPENAIPEWAKTLSEEKWKKNLLDALNAKKTDLFSN